MNDQFNARLPKLTHDQLEAIAGEYGLTKTQIVILAIDNLHQRLLPNDNWMQPLSEKERALVQDSE